MNDFSQGVVVGAALASLIAVVARVSWEVGKGTKPEEREFDYTIGRLDYIISKLVGWGRDTSLLRADKQTLKHHAEDMIAAGQKILRDLQLDSSDDIWKP